MSQAVSLGLMGSTPADVIRALAPRLERLGFDALWLNDVPGGDSLAGLRVAAEATATLRLATGVIPVDRRPADSLDLDGLPAERTTIGIGSGGAARPLGLVRDAVHRLRERTSASVVVGALGPRMRRLAAEESDGVLLNWLTPDAAAEAMRDLTADSAAAGRHDVRGILYVRTIVEAAARPNLVVEAAKYDSFPSYAANFERLGFAAIDATIDGAEGLAAYLRAPDEGSSVDEIVLRAITPSGSSTELEAFAERAASWIQAARS
ncbi:LLM class flavin-dependent oxidoreductase [Agromyces salentinus]|uniref:TIGR03620 family F420-dependent LLM class oxidoreductase n=1 Tax=Agromyces salentinus TaxID=269421 RepID=A0ABN2N4Z7_9MICO|nr:LLM class flavin-dependent oxidoreductase [Agromyces salentinus]